LRIIPAQPRPLLQPEQEPLRPIRKGGDPRIVKTNKRWGWIIVPVLAVFISGYWLYDSKAYYPALPFEGASTKIIVGKLKSSDNELVELANVDGYYWLGYKGNQKAGMDHVVEKMEEKGSEYDYYEGAGIFFENNGRVVVTGTMWTSKYVLYKIPEEAYTS